MDLAFSLLRFSLEARAVFHPHCKAWWGMAGSLLFFPVSIVPSMRQHPQGLQRLSLKPHKPVPTRMRRSTQQYFLQHQPLALLARRPRHPAGSPQPVCPLPPPPAEGARGPAQAPGGDTCQLQLLAVSAVLGVRRGGGGGGRGRSLYPCHPGTSPLENRLLS